jgi:hypothetical protein
MTGPELHLARVVRDRLGPHKRDRTPSGGAGKDPPQCGDRSTEPYHHGPTSSGPHRQKHQWVTTRGPHDARNPGAAMQAATRPMNGRPDRGFHTKETLLSQPKPMQ